MFGCDNRDIRFQQMKWGHDDDLLSSYKLGRSTRICRGIVIFTLVIRVYLIAIIFKDYLLFWGLYEQHLMGIDLIEGFL
jgi:hypothetical protein